MLANRRWPRCNPFSSLVILKQLRTDFMPCSNIFAAAVAKNIPLTDSGRWNNGNHLFGWRRIRVLSSHHYEAVFLLMCCAYCHHCHYLTIFRYVFSSVHTLGDIICDIFTQNNKKTQWQTPTQWHMHTNDGHSPSDITQWQTSTQWHTLTQLHTHRVTNTHPVTCIQSNRPIQWHTHTNDGHSPSDITQWQTSDIHLPSDTPTE